MFNGLPPMDQPSVAILGNVDVNRNGAPPGGLHADLREPATPVEKAAAPGAALMRSDWAVLAGLVVAFLLVNGRKG